MVSKGRKHTPPPGSARAQIQGCTCSRPKNGTPQMFWSRLADEQCPLHFVKKPKRRLNHKSVPSWSIPSSTAAPESTWTVSPSQVSDSWVWETQTAEQAHAIFGEAEAQVAEAQVQAPISIGNSTAFSKAIQDFSNQMVEKMQTNKPLITKAFYVKSEV